MHQIPSPWLAKLVWRRFIVISGLLALAAGSGLFRLGLDLVTGPNWQPPVRQPFAANALFAFLFVYSIVWIGGSLGGLRSLAKDSSLRHKIESQWWSVPLLIQIIVLTEFWVVATFYVLLTADICKGVLLGMLFILNALGVFLFGPVLTTYNRGHEAGG
ncbi:MAG: hypothetical protein H6649_05850 [Caldilineae bacterium]|nr:hypothetical protein [Anaerolineae bacterium]MCB0252830.1 hypothetical protein [Anaerolineae bacterium]MCB9153567.1 hypothetical protein [Caldilineae bacterium]